MTFSESGPVPSQGEVAQQMFTYTAFTADFVKEGLPVVNEDGTPKWRFAPSPHGVYWKDGMKLGYQDVGSWTLLKSTPDDRAKAAWLYAQFVTSKTVDVKKSHVGLTFIREVDDPAQVLHRSRAEARRPDRVLPFAGPRPVVADRHEHAGLSEAGAALVAGDRRCVVGRQDCAGSDGLALRRAGKRAGAPRARRRQGDIGPKLAEEHDLAYWNADAVQAGNLAPQLKIENEKEKPHHHQLRRAGEELAVSNIGSGVRARILKPDI